MGRIRRGGYIFEFWVGDHPPKHVHIYKDGRLVARAELDDTFTTMEGRVTKRLRKILKSLVKEGTLK